MKLKFKKLEGIAGDCGKSHILHHKRLRVCFYTGEDESVKNPYFRIFYTVSDPWNLFVGRWYKTKALTFFLLSTNFGNVSPIFKNFVAQEYILTKNYSQ